MLASARLRLLPLSGEALRSYLTTPDALEKALGVRLPQDTLDATVRRAMEAKISKMQHADDQQHWWYTYWLAIEPDTQFGVGMLGFKGEPDWHGAVEIGYGIESAHQGKGYATEAATTLIDWAFQHADCKSVTALIYASNTASIRVAQKLGMQYLREQAGVQTWQRIKSIG